MFVAIRFFVGVAFSVLIFVVIGAKFYLPLATLVVLFALIVTIANESHHRKAPDKLSLPPQPDDDTLHRAAIDYLTLLGVSLIVGMLWPSLPMYIWYSRT